MLSRTYREEIERCIGQARWLGQLARRACWPAPAGTDADNGKLTLQPAWRGLRAPDL